MDSAETKIKEVTNIIKNLVSKFPFICNFLYYN